MIRLIAYVLSISWSIAGMAIFSWPMHFYTLVPGVPNLGPFNIHFISDVALAFLACGSVATYGVWKRSTALIVAATVWPMLHALMHLHMWVHRGMPLDSIAVFDGVFIIAPAILMLSFARSLGDERKLISKS